MDKDLKHYGILGMKWGIRRYQPYPKGEGHKGIFKGKKTTSKLSSKDESNAWKAIARDIESGKIKTNKKGMARVT